AGRRTARDSSDDRVRRGRPDGRRLRLDMLEPTAWKPPHRHDERHGHDAGHDWVRNPPAIGPIAVRPPEMPKKIAIALPRSRSGNEATTIATAAGNSSAAVVPWTTRKKMTHTSAIEPLGVSPHAADAIANPVTPIITVRRQDKVLA